MYEINKDFFFIKKYYFIKMAGAQEQNNINKVSKYTADQHELQELIPIQPLIPLIIKCFLKCIVFVILIYSHIFIVRINASDTLSDVLCVEGPSLYTITKLVIFHLTVGLLGILGCYCLEDFLHLSRRMLLFF